MDLRFTSIANPVIGQTDEVDTFGLLLDDANLDRGHDALAVVCGSFM